MLKDSVGQNLGSAWLDIPHASWGFLYSCYDMLSGSLVLPRLYWVGCPRWLTCMACSLMLAILWDLIWGGSVYQLDRLHVAYICGLSFFTAWWPQSSQNSNMAAQGSSSSKATEGGSCMAFFDLALDITQYSFGCTLC